jgi:hypothetical protein
MYDRYQTCFAEIGVPLLERIEHLFVTGEFINNLLRREAAFTPRYEDCAIRLAKLRRRFSDRLRILCLDLSRRTIVEADERERFQQLREQLELCWSKLLEEAETAGIDEPLAWISTGDLRPEYTRGICYDGRRLTTRSGVIEV